MIVIDKHFSYWVSCHALTGQNPAWFTVPGTVLLPLVHKSTSNIIHTIDVQNYNLHPYTKVLSIVSFNCFFYKYKIQVETMLGPNNLHCDPLFHMIFFQLCATD